MTLLWFILILGAIILVHEFGHFLFAKLSGTYVYEFSIGMGPKLWSFKKKGGETEFFIRWIPLGGYVRLAGEEIDDDKKIPKNRKLYNKSFIQRFLIMIAGATFNFIFAFFVLFISALIFGSVSVKPIISDVPVGYPAYVAGIEVGDTILKINDEKVSSWGSVQLAIQGSKGEELVFEVKDTDNKVKTITVVPELQKDDNDNEIYVVGISKTNVRDKGFGKSLSYATYTTKSLFVLMIDTVKSLFTGGVNVSDLSGPVGIYTIVGDQAKAGFESILYLVAFLSINVGVINLIPFPAFDGGRVLFLFIEKIIRKPIPSKFENTVNAIGFLLLIALMIYVTFNDILRLFN